MNEIWRDISSYEGLYQVSNLGNVKSLNYLRTGNERMLKPVKNRYGYLLVNLCKNGKTRLFKVHRLVAKAFIPNTNNKSDVNHKDENKANNCVDNLEWTTRKENINYGTHNERMSKSKSKAVIQYSLDGEFIRKWPSATQIKIELGFSQSHISDCCKGKQKTAYGYIWKYA